MINIISNINEITHHPRILQKFKGKIVSVLAEMCNLYLHRNHYHVVIQQLYHLCVVFHKYLNKIVPALKELANYNS